MNNKQLACIYIVCTVIQIFTVVACSVPKKSEVDHNYDTPKGYYVLKPYFRNGKQVLNITHLYLIKGVWNYQGKPVVIEAGREKDFSTWANSWSEFVDEKRK